MKTLTEQIASIRRELGLRQGVYPRLVAQRRMSEAKAAHEIACMKAVLATLELLNQPVSVERDLM